MTANTPIRVVIADDHPMFRYGLTAALAASDEVQVVGEAADGDELQRVVDEVRPDIVITDLAMPGTDGATATRSLLARHAEVGVLVLTMHEDDEALFGALRAGARAISSRAPTVRRSSVPFWRWPPGTPSTARPWHAASWRSSPAPTSITRRGSSPT